MKTYYYNTSAKGFYDAQFGMSAKAEQIIREVAAGEAHFAGDKAFCYRAPREPETLKEPANGVDQGETKPSNPKDVIGARKLDLGLVPDTLVVGAANALLEGALKYGRFNWRVAGVRASIYHAALRRHLAKWWSGQDRDSVTLVHHLDNAIACLAILRDAELYEQLTDDRPPCPSPNVLAARIDQGEAIVKHLREVFKNEKPYQYTIADTPRS